MILITNFEELSLFELKPEQIFRVENALFGTKLINDNLWIVDVRGYGGEVEDGQCDALKGALECNKIIELIENPTAEQRLEFALNTSQTIAALKEGWALFACEGKIKIKKDDDLNLFKTVEDAHHLIKKKASEGSFLHLKIKTFLECYSPKEYQLIFR